MIYKSYGWLRVTTLCDDFSRTFGVFKTDIMMTFLLILLCFNQINMSQLQHSSSQQQQDPLQPQQVQQVVLPFVDTVMSSPLFPLHCYKLNFLLRTHV